VAIDLVVETERDLETWRGGRKITRELLYPRQKARHTEPRGRRSNV